MSKKRTFVSIDDIINEPYGYTYKEISECMGESEAKRMFFSLYKEKNKNQHQTIKIHSVNKDGTGTQKYVFKLSDNNYIETVSIKRRNGTTACVSTMVGCPVGCIFCESGSNGFIRNLTPSEIVQQVVLLPKDVNRIVFMGMGEPLFNYDSLIKSIHILRDRNGLDFSTSGITISTVGPLNQLKKLREEHIKIQLTLSLHATTQKVRNMIIPNMAKSDVNSTVESMLSYSERHNRKITIAYLLIPGVNDKVSDVDKLIKWFYGKNVMVNLLQYNPTNCGKFKRPNKQMLSDFKMKLEKGGLYVKIRESKGTNINAACGQLVSEYNKKKNPDSKKNANTCK